MPANSGALTGTIAHKHSALSADGGFLDDGVTGVTGTANGSLLMFDGSSIAQDLPAGNLNDVLTMGAAVPAWTAPAGGSATVEKIAELIQPADDPYLTLTFPAVTNSTVSKYYGVCSGGFTTSSLNSVDMTMNGLANNNVWRVFRDSAGATTYAASTGGGVIQVIRNPYNNRWSIWFEITMNPLSENLQMHSIATTTAPEVQECFATNTTAGTTTLSEIEFHQSNGAGDILQNTIVSLFKVNL